MKFIELHYKGDPRLINISKISTIWGGENTTVCIWMIGESDALYVDEPYDKIKVKLQEAGFIWNA
jgi:hypothetical protein